MGWWSWSRTASSNASADASINWAEGQAPSSVNDSARAMMAALAKARDDISGAIATGGTSTAYTVTSYGVFDTLAHMDGQLIAFTPHTANGATVTLNVDGLGAKPLRSAPSVELQGGALIQGTPYLALYNNSDAAFYLHGASNYNTYSVPLACGMICFDSVAPNSAFAFPYGQAISRTTYATLFARISTTFGTGDGSTTFNLPDLRGRVVAGLDNMGGSSASRLSTAMTSTSMGNTGGAQQHTLLQPELPNVTVGVSVTVGPTNLTSTLADYVRAPSGMLQVAAGVGGFAPNTQTVTGVTTPLSLVATGATNALGNSTAFNTIPPTMVANYIMRII